MYNAYFYLRLFRLDKIYIYNCAVASYVVHLIVIVECICCMEYYITCFLWLQDCGVRLMHYGKFLMGQWTVENSSSNVISLQAYSTLYVDKICQQKLHYWKVLDKVIFLSLVEENFSTSVSISAFKVLPVKGREQQKIFGRKNGMFAAYFIFLGMELRCGRGQWVISDPPWQG